MKDFHTLKLADDILKRADDIKKVYEFQATSFVHESDVREAKKNAQIVEDMKELTEKYKSNLLKLFGEEI